MNPSTLIADPARSMLAADKSLEGLGIQVLSASEGRATAILKVAPEMANGHGIAHGGLVFALADTAFAMAATPSVPESRPPRLPSPTFPRRTSPTNWWPPPR